MSESKIILKRTAKEVIDFIEKWKLSGLTKKEFCLNERLNYQTFMGWMGRRKPKSSNLKSNFIPLQMNLASGGPFAEVHLGNNRRIIFHQPVSLEFFQAVLKC